MTLFPQRARSATAVAAWLIAAALPLVGLVSLLLRSQLDPHFENYRLHFLVFGAVGAVAFVLGFAAGEAARRRGDARVLLLSLAFMATGGAETYGQLPVGTVVGAKTGLQLKGRVDAINAYVLLALP